MRVTRVYHAGRSPGHRGRERALVQLGHDVTLIVPSNWREGGAELELTDEPFSIVELPVQRPDDVNRHTYASSDHLQWAIGQSRPDIVDVHEEPFSAVMRQVLRVLPADFPAVGYAAQNVDKRYPPPFNGWEQRAYKRLSGLYPCSRQAAAVVRRRGFAGHVSVLDLGSDTDVFVEGNQQHADVVWTVAFVGRLVPEKGVRDAVRAFASLRAVRPARMVIAGRGSEREAALELAASLGCLSDVLALDWLAPADVAELYRRSHVALVPSVATARWVEQYGRMITEAQACGAVVLGYASGSIPEVSRGAAMLNAEGDTLGLQRSACALAADASLWESLRRNGIEQSARCAWQNVARAQTAFYEEVLAVRRPRGVPGEDFGASAQLSQGMARPFAVPILRSLPFTAKTAARFDRIARR